MIVKTTEFIKSGTKPAHYPEGDLPEIAFAGRSNVGKSSLINVLVNRKNLVRTSSTPGRTQLINFFQVNQDFMLVDLPGYGYAKVPLDVKRNWRPMMETYLSKRENLVGVVLILDIRRVPVDEDLQMLEWLRAFSIPPIVVVTKCDKVSKNERAKQSAVIMQRMGLDKGDLNYFSALSKEGKEGIWDRIDALLAKAALPPVTEPGTASQEDASVEPKELTD
ncbi:putative GTP-binding protein EngB [Geomonas silvestris]|uniref:Probable GTP-binding protein EngB n=1 Tax=Geomonas silvestris TaxID=2740184 RepID=A0A6V8MF05_9BACT|nr:ribosome biogenesis GTP-binding protein YihA/YsxC [Geomonas silvestris]GFO58567.1 putative GTP-binding protein EngB [Geomonas silvestris]